MQMQKKKKKKKKKIHPDTGRIQHCLGNVPMDGYQGPEFLFRGRRSPVLSTKAIVSASQHISSQIGVFFFFF